MATLSLQGKEYEVNELKFLLDFNAWDEDFAVGMARRIGIGELTDKHWAIINFIRYKFKQTDHSPLIYETCMSNGMSLKQLAELFPAGHTRGACRLAGIPCHQSSNEKVYRTDVFGFLIDPLEWDHDYAVNKAYELQTTIGLTARHWEMINSLRDNFRKNNQLLTVFECCEINHIEIEELRNFFPSGYQSGLVKIAGLRQQSEQSRTIGDRPR